MSSIAKLKTLADKGDAAAQYKLGLLYYEGKELSRNYEKTFDLWLEAAKQDHIEAQCGLGMLYDCGIGIYKQRNFSAKWFFKAGIVLLRAGETKRAAEVSNRLRSVATTTNMSTLLADVLDDEVEFACEKGCLINDKHSNNLAYN